MTTALVKPALSPWADWDSKLNFAAALVETGFLPKAITKPAQVLAIILTGQELGIPPMFALRSIDVIEGKPSLSANLQLALFKQRGGRSQWRHSDEKKAVLWLRHPNGDEHVETFTWEDAAKAKLVAKMVWQLYPKAMLRARCITAGLRAIAPEITAGLFDPEELGADDADAVTDGDVVELGDAPEAPAPVEDAEPAHDVPTSEAGDRDRDRGDTAADWSLYTEPEVWKDFTTPEQIELIADKNSAKQRLGIG